MTVEVVEVVEGVKLVDQNASDSSLLWGAR